MITDNGDGTYTVKVVLNGNVFTDTFDELYEAEALVEQIKIFNQCN